MTPHMGHQGPYLGYLRLWNWRWNQKLWELGESRTIGGGAIADGDEGEHFGGAKCLMGERADWRDPGVYVGIKRGNCTRTRTVGRG